MKVRTVREHANRYGEAKPDNSHRAKKVDDLYEHPEPRTLIESGFVVDAAAAEPAEAQSKKAAKGKPAADA